MRRDGRVDQVVDFLTPLPRDGADEEYGRPPHHGKLHSEILDALLVGGVVLVDDSVPFVADDDAGASVVGDLLSENAVLLSDACGGVEDEEDHVRATDGPEGPVDHEKFGSEIDLVLPSDSSSVNKSVLDGGGDSVRTGAFHERVDRVPGSSGHLRYDGTLISKKFVKEGRFSYIGPADDGDVDFLLCQIVVVTIPKRILFFLYFSPVFFHNVAKIGELCQQFLIFDLVFACGQLRDAFKKSL
mmetsp:Transcript_1262/g.2564  ORF Transcript_1262/g.2564 Transcript_1262/m.2564 type:complete len:243 (-) Transcript_1262:838-1566(-)